jgi:hypothetical protein
MKLWRRMVHGTLRCLPGLALAAIAAVCWRTGTAPARATAAQAPATQRPPAPAAKARSSPAAPKAPSIANPHGDIRVACEACHTAESWTSMRTPSSFDHAKTGFLLEGRHGNAACRDCHRFLVFSHVATSCADCHRDVHEGRNGLRCQDCHAPVRWAARSDAVRQHAATGFPLRGMHALVECSRCHAGSGEGHLAKASQECSSCHAADYAAAAARVPSHDTFATRCEDCHSAARTTWTGAGFDHAASGFPLTGAHARTACTACHVGGTYAGTPTDCYACHRIDYEGTTNPNHTAAGFSTQCVACHSTTTWQGATFDHVSTGFALTGAHQTTSCTACHAGGTYAGTPTDCYACHRTDYEGTTNPNHAAAGFSIQCVACHSTTTWQGATFDHDNQFFRIYSGKHRGKWTSCTECHMNPSSYRDFTCTTCHHTQATTDAIGAHRSRPEYRYESNACYSCHRNV